MATTVDGKKCPLCGRSAVVIDRGEAHRYAAVVSDFVVLFSNEKRYDLYVDVGAQISDARPRGKQVYTTTYPTGVALVR